MKKNKMLWEDPSSAYRGIPMWSWNGELQPEILKEQLSDLGKMGFGGAEIHSRIGLETEYLGGKFMDCVRECVDAAKENSMKIWLYDEDKWPSGFGAGRVTEGHPEYACRYLFFSKNYYPNGYHKRDKVFTSRVAGSGELELLRTYEISLRDGRLADYSCRDEVREGENIWYLYLCIMEPSAWFNNSSYGDTLNPEAMKRFLEVAYEPYAAAVGEEFGSTVEAVFTDEPCFYKAENLRDGEQAEDIGLPYSDALGRLYSEKYGGELLEQIPEIVWEYADGTVSPVRYRYHVCLSELFTTAYAAQLGTWSREHQLLFTGHLLGENTLDNMTRSIGEVMYTLAQWDLPGCDMLANRHEYTTAKQAQSVTHQFGRRGVMCEIYGVTNWDFDFRGHKHMGDWLAALGVTVRVPHLAWMTMKGEAKRDYPSPIDGHTTWYEKYPLLEDYYARLNMILESGSPVVRIGVIHPVESYWIQLGPDSTTGQARRQLEEQYQQLAEWLLFGLLDFDYLSEALLARHGDAEADGLRVGVMKYDVVVVPPLYTIRRATLSLLQRFGENGGKVIVMGDAPACVDGCRDNSAEEAFRKFMRIGFDRWELLKRLQEYREIDILSPEGVPADRLLYQLRQDGEDRYLFIVHGKKDTGLEYNLWSDTKEGEEWVISVRGAWSVRKLDCESAKAESIRTRYEKGRTRMDVRLYEDDSLMLMLSPAETGVCDTQRTGMTGSVDVGEGTDDVSAVREGAGSECTVREITCSAGIDEDGGVRCVTSEGIGSAEQKAADKHVHEYNLRGGFGYSLWEPNVFLLDQAEYSVDDGEWMAAEEILRIDDGLRRRLGYPLRSDSMPQPWLRSGSPEEHVVTLRFVIRSDIELPDVTLALENKKARIQWNGKEIRRTKTGRYYVDRAIACEELGALRKGQNILVLSFPYGPDTDMEWCYLLGDFGVYIRGGHAVIDSKPDQIVFSDIVYQGFPFYGGNITYHIGLTGQGGRMGLQVPEYEAVLLHAELDGAQGQDFYRAPCKVYFETEPGKEHMVDLTAYGNRINTFGQLHNCNRREEYYGPNTWRTKGKKWSYSYQFHRFGILVPPVIV